MMIFACDLNYIYRGATEAIVHFWHLGYVYWVLLMERFVIETLIIDFEYFVIYKFLHLSGELNFLFFASGESY